MSGKYAETPGTGPRVGDAVGVAVEVPVGVTVGVGLAVATGTIVPVPRTFTSVREFSSEGRGRVQVAKGGFDPSVAGAGAPWHPLAMESMERPAVTIHTLSRFPMPASLFLSVKYQARELYSLRR